MFIESLQNSHVKDWCKLKQKKYRDETGLFLIEGDHLILEAQKKGAIKEVISIDKEVPATFYVTKEIMKKITNQVSISKTVAVCYKLKEQPIGEKVLFLDGLQDPGNLGTIIRSAIAFSFDTILLSEDCVDVYNDKTIRSSEGMLFHMNIRRCNSKYLLPQLKKEHAIFVTDVKKGKNIKEINYQRKVVIVIGSEGSGVREKTKEYATDFIKINMNPLCESLNAGVAASILMHDYREASHE